jgi:hypothetical protein
VPAKIPGILEIYRIVEFAEVREIPIRVYLGQEERLIAPNLYRAVPNLHIRTPICLPRGLHQEPMKALDPKGPPQAHLPGIHRATTTPMTTTVTTEHNEADLIGPCHRCAVDVGGIVKVKKRTVVEPRVDVDLQGRVHRSGPPKATVMID